jgi:hypothetical protein
MSENVKNRTKFFKKTKLYKLFYFSKNILKLEKKNIEKKLNSKLNIIIVRAEKERKMKH